MAATVGQGDDAKAGDTLGERLRASAEMPAASGHGGGHAGGWAYSGETGPDHRGKIEEDYEACGTGRMQSPVDLQGMAVNGQPKIVFDYKLTVPEVVNNGHTFQITYAPGSAVFVNGERFELLQFHFHSPSEHARDGQRYPMETHLVHKNAEGKLAVIGVFMERGNENLALMEIWDHMPAEAGPVAAVERVALNVRDLLPSGTQFHRYMGSLTTPPCSEGENWFVGDTTVTVSEAQIDKFLQTVGESARPLQALNNRLLAGPTAHN